MKEGVYEIPTSPYRKLAEHAGIGYSDFERRVRNRGIEGALEELYAAGVYLTLDEFKGRKSIVRGDLEIKVTTRDFDNPLSSRHVIAQTGGSRSRATRTALDLALYEQDAVYDLLFMIAFDILCRPHGLWRPPPPYAAGLKSTLSRAKLGMTAERWFAQSRPTLDAHGWKSWLLTQYIVQAGRLFGLGIAAPEHVPLADAVRVARWLATKKRIGQAAWLNCNAASGVRVAMAALEESLDISGTLFRFGGEPLTAGKAKVIAETGSRVVCHYTMGETGRIGVACAASQAIDEVHILEDKMAVIQREKALTGSNRVLTNVYTTLLPSTPKLMINVESGDYGVLAQRSCGCFWGQLGYNRHLHTIRSYDKLTSEGMNFLGSDLIHLVEEVLPNRFGGYPTDYQFFEDEENGLPKVNLIVSPRIGRIDEEDAVATVIHFLNSLAKPGGKFGERWRDGQTLRVLRREPNATNASKVLALHVQQTRSETH